MEITILFIICLAIMLIGLLGVILQFLPGAPLALLGFSIFAAKTDFEKISLNTVLVFFGLTLLVSLLDFFMPLLGAKKYKASKGGVIGAFLGSVFGILIFSIPGIIIGPLLGAALGELSSNKDAKQAVRSVLGTFFGILIGTLLKVILVFVMIGFLIVSIF